jgi:hypothetical protein
VNELMLVSVLSGSWWNDEVEFKFHDERGAYTVTNRLRRLPSSFYEYEKKCEGIPGRVGDRLQQLATGKSGLILVAEASAQTLRTAEPIVALRDGAYEFLIRLEIALWMVQDFFLLTDEFIVLCDEAGKLGTYPGYWVFEHFDAAGKCEPTQFSREGLEKGIACLNRLVNPNNQALTTRVLNLTGLLRWTFKQRDHAFRISCNVICLEALVQRGVNTELTHQLAERVAILAKECNQKPADVYAFVKKAYKVRSKLLHGEPGDPSDPQMTTELDNILRLLFSDDDKGKWRFPFLFEDNAATCDDEFLKRLLPQ